MEKKHYKKYNETVYKKTLANGLKVLLVPKNDFHKTFAVFATDFGGADLSFIPFGKTNKTVQPAGIAHFLEHVLFKMPDGSDAFETLDALGVNSNAFTSYDKTAYLISGTDNINEAITFLLDFVQTPHFTNKIIENEQGIIAEEINMYLDDPGSILFNTLIRNTYKNNYVKEEILGTVESINKITKHALYTAHDTFYHPSNMSLVIAGNFNPDEMLNLILTNQSKKNYEAREKVNRFIPNEPKKVQIKDETIEANIATPLVGVSIKFKDNENLKEQYFKAVKLGLLLEYYFSGSSEIYEELLNNELINSSFSYYVNLYKDTLSIQIASYTKKPEELVAALKKILINLKRRNINEERFLMFKRANYGSFVKSLNRVESIVYSYLDFIRLDLDLFEIPKIIGNINSKDVFSLQDEIKSDVISTLIINPKKV